jgi:hypothetical protein
MKTCCLTLLTLAMLGSVLTGCKTQTGALPPVDATKYDTENKSSFVLMDEGAQHSITCSGLQQTTLPDGRLEVAANIRNRENRRLDVQVNCEFKDEQGFVVDTVPWQTLILTENGQETVRFTSMNSQAKKYTVRVRQSR